MNDSENPADTTIRYMDAELSGEELLAFERALQQDDALRAELENLILAKKVVEHYGLKQQVSMVHQQMIREEVKKPIVTISFILRIAAIFTVCVLAFSTYTYLSLAPSDIVSADKLSYTLNTERGTASSSVIEKSYRQQDYHAVISTYELETHPQVNEQFLAAQSYRELQQPAKAITILKSLNGTASAVAYQDDIDYYLALSYLEDNQPSAAYNLLEKIYASKDHLYHDRVDDLMLLKLKLYIFKTGK